ncbi:transcription elongation factor GreB [Pseudoalteromonas piratica]|uniref:Transcription elongation factor GreB n=1 Tax=Pseudoalteromonas piratica TaxID=1348114 RepID=A0A0A7EDH4_9GAMM|nr:transcription elongation factor GreB [Pseudoalteromonas piratica]AIY64101.1 transcription elongation factor GreB [Pseudoalteromonas piratica]
MRKPPKQTFPKRSNYITRSGYDELERELRYLWKEERPRVTQAVSEAAALGDRSENAEYIYGKKRLREIDRRVRFLTKRLEQLNIVYPKAEQAGKVFFGAHVEVENEEGEVFNYQLVGPDEFDVSQGKISIDSPFARAMLGKQQDDEFEFNNAEGVTLFFINSIHYDVAQ